MGHQHCSATCTCAAARQVPAIVQLQVQLSTAAVRKAECRLHYLHFPAMCRAQREACPAARHSRGTAA